MAYYKNQKKICLNLNNCTGPAILEKYGFGYNISRKQWFYSTGNLGKYRRPASPTIVYCDDGTLNVTSNGAVTLEVICKMYKDGIIQFQATSTVYHRIAKKREQIAKLQAEIDKLKKEL